MFFNAFFALSFRSLELSGRTKTANNREGTSASAKNFAWSGECLPICPRLQAAAALRWSSYSFIKASFKGAIPLETITAIAKESSKADI